jgi:dipeptidyl aminopeptidase/acylaminoacyl peptidase
MNSFRFHRFLLIGLSGLLFVLLAACGPTPPPTTSGPTATPIATLTPSVTPEGTATPTPAVTTVAVPPTQTGCPAAGTARAAVLAPLALGNHQAIVYIAAAQGATTLYRYDVITGVKTQIVQGTNETISEAQISADGQWILFVSGTASAPGKLQLVRMDGQGLQTLYCDSTSSRFQWATNQQLIAFESKSESTDFVKLLRVTDGTIETALSQPLNTPYAYALRTWLDTTRLYLTRYDTDVPPDALAVLDLQKGLNQTVSDLISVVNREPGQFQDFDSGYDGAHVFVAHSACAYECSGPGNITVQPALGGREHTIYSSQVYSVVKVRAVTQKTLLFQVGNHGFPNQNSGDLSHNGLWMIHTDGTGLTRLTTDSANLYTRLNADSQYPWSNVSRDGNLYAVEQQTSQKSGNPDTAQLFFGSLSGGTPTSFASTSDGTQLSIVGWTTMA